MGRPVKRTMDFFIHDAGAMNDNALQVVMHIHGSHGYAVYFMLLEMLCKENEAQLSLANSTMAQVVAMRTKSHDAIHLCRVIDTLAEVGLFDRQMWEESRTVFSHGLYNRYMARLKSNQVEAERKRQTRKAEAFQERIEALTHKQIPQPDPDPDLERDLDPEKDPDNRSRSIYRVSESDNSGQPSDNGVVRPDNSVVWSANAVDRQAAQFLKRPWREQKGAVNDAFLEYVAKVLPSSDTDDTHQKTKARSHVLNLERSGDREKLEGYWKDFTEFKSQPSAKAKTKPKLVPIRLTPEEAEEKFRQTLQNNPA